VGGGREATHIIAESSHDLLGAPPGDAGDGIESFQGRGETHVKDTSPDTSPDTSSVHVKCSATL
jgi:hypothetical protein